MSSQRLRAAFCAFAGCFAITSAACLPDENCADTATCPPIVNDAPESGADITVDTGSPGNARAPRDAGAQLDVSSKLDTKPDVEVAHDLEAGQRLCGPMFKLCGGECVSVEDPSYGCGATTCTAANCPSADAGTLVCEGINCVLGICGAGTKKCGSICVRVDDSNYGCGDTSCDKSRCPSAAGAMLACRAGACVIGACGPGLKNCGDKCVSVSDPAYGCGATTCDNALCPPPGTGTLTCQAGLCVIGTCGSGYKKCAGMCVAVDDPAYGCGATTCDAAACPAPGTGTLVCQAGACAVGTCGPGTKKCGNKCVPLDRNNGCADSAVCTSCAPTETCTGLPVARCSCVSDNVAACVNKNCGSAINNCGATISCGTCTPPQSCMGGGIANKCGCTPVNPCTGGKCGTFNDGCGASVTCNCTAPNQCGMGGIPGMCGAPQAQTCVAGVKTAVPVCDRMGTCAPPVKTTCPNGCNSTGTDCLTCSAGQAACAGTCCAAGQWCCSNRCVSLNSPTNCGTCGHDCTVLAHVGSTTNVTCNAATGGCVVPPSACTAGFANCSSSVNDVDGCETSTTTNTDCGGCNRPCSIDNANATCASGTCAIASCIGSAHQCGGRCLPDSDATCGAACTNCTSLGQRCVSGACVQCVSDQDCPGGRPTCSATTHTCGCREKSAGNLVVNPGFNTGMTSWDFGSNIWDPVLDADACSGSGSMFQANDRSTTAPYQCIPVSPGTRYNFGAKVQGNGMTPVDLYRCSGAIVHGPDCADRAPHDPGFNVAVPTGSPIGTWVSLSSTFTTPSSADQLNLALFCYHLDGNLDQVYVNAGGMF